MESENNMIYEFNKYYDHNDYKCINFYRITKNCI